MRAISAAAASRQRGSWGTTVTSRCFGIDSPSTEVGFDERAHALAEHRGIEAQILCFAVGEPVGDPLEHEEEHRVVLPAPAPPRLLAHPCHRVELPYALEAVRLARERIGGHDRVKAGAQRAPSAV